MNLVVWKYINENCNVLAIRQVEVCKLQFIYVCYMPTDRYMHISLSRVNDFVNICSVECTKIHFRFCHTLPEENATFNRHEPLWVMVITYIPNMNVIKQVCLPPWSKQLSSLQIYIYSFNVSFGFKVGLVLLF